MRIFHKKDGGIIQLVGKKKMQKWPLELPLIFVEWIRNNKLEEYGDAKVKREIENYLDEVMEHVAIPRFISVIKGDDEEETILALTRLEELSKKNIEMVKPIKTYLDELKEKKNKKIVELAEAISKNFQRDERKKLLAKKRKKTREMEKKFMEGKVSGEEYAKARKEYLELRES